MTALLVLPAKPLAVLPILEQFFFEDNNQVMSVRKAVGINSLSTFISFALQLASVTALSRLLTPKEIGAYSISLAFVALIAIVRDFGVGIYIIQEKELTSLRLRTAITVLTSISWLLGLVTVASSRLIADFYGISAMEEVIRVISLNFFFVPFIAVIQACLQRQLQFGKNMMITISGSAAATATSIFLAYSGWSISSLSYSSIIGTMVSLLVAIIVRPKVLTWRPSIAELRHLFSFGWKVVYSNSLAQIGMSSSDLILGKTLGMSDVALLSRANALRSLVVTHILSIVQSTFVPTFADEIRKAKNIRALYIERNLILCAIYLPVYAITVVIAKPLILFMFGSQWLSSVPVAQILCLGSMFGAPVSLVRTVLLASGKITVIAKLETFIMVVRIVAIAIGSFFGLVWVASFMFVESIIFVFFLGNAAKIQLSLSFSDIYLKCFPSILLAILCGASAYLGTLILPLNIESSTSVFYSLFVSSMFGILTWITALYTLHHPLAQEFRPVMRYLVNKL